MARKTNTAVQLKAKADESETEAGVDLATEPGAPSEPATEQENGPKDESAVEGTEESTEALLNRLKGMAPADIIKSIGGTTRGAINATIRTLAAKGLSRGQIAMLTGKRYQHVRNVLTQPIKRATIAAKGATAKHPAPITVASITIQEQEEAGDETTTTN